MAKKEKSYFWASYADMMTSLFFIMLTLFAVTVVSLNKERKKIEEERSGFEEKFKADSLELKKIEEIEAATQNLEKECRFFTYIPEHKKHKLTIDVNFPTDNANIYSVPELTRQQLKNAGDSLMLYISGTVNRHPEVQYLIIIEGQASRDNASERHNYELSYQRAYALTKFWEEKVTGFPGENCEIIICGSGTGDINGTGLMRETTEKLNQRFLIHIIPKPGEVERDETAESSNM